MRKTALIFIFLFFILSVYSIKSYSISLTLNNVPAQIFFSPKGGCTEAIVKEIDKATLEVLVQAYSFTSVPIAKALVNACRRGANVEAVLDKSQKNTKNSSAGFLANMKISTYIDEKHLIANNKIIIIDKTTIITGSFNFTKAAEDKNAENVLIIRDKGLAAVYIDNFLKHKQHSKKFNQR